MKDDHFQTSPLPSNNGYTWTLATRLGDMIAEVEKRYGQRDQSWTVLGIEFSPNGPQIWYPGNRKHVAIQLAPNALQDTVLACYQLAHESVHLLSPAGGRGAPVIEEGLATVFSEDYVQQVFFRKGLTNMSSYSEAATLVRDLLSIAPDAISRLRSIEPAFTKMTNATFIEAELEAPESLVTQLLSQFCR
ncbi:hypothetical protein [Pseudomonas folii]|uniref:IrrE N-terminal-like domain-containing protein n=1 Tax=Pseudomonas folii TaxID=2762593 RepID=A0ABR7AZ30_9PSED|nr:hypothetical protein [Pseudomonas folii]MBC3950183.1 hypothetical protein [Pseudomonas folii]